MTDRARKGAEFCGATSFHTLFQSALLANVDAALLRFYEAFRECGHWVRFPYALPIFGSASHDGRRMPGTMARLARGRTLPPTLAEHSSQRGRFHGVRRRTRRPGMAGGTTPPHGATRFVETTRGILSRRSAPESPQSPGGSVDAATLLLCGWPVGGRAGVRRAERFVGGPAYPDGLGADGPGGFRRPVGSIPGSGLWIAPGTRLDPSRRGTGRPLIAVGLADRSGGCTPTAGRP